MPEQSEMTMGEIFELNKSLRSEVEFLKNMCNEKDERLKSLDEENEKWAKMINGLRSELEMVSNLAKERQEAFDRISRDYSMFSAAHTDLVQRMYFQNTTVLVFFSQILSLINWDFLINSIKFESLQTPDHKKAQDLQAMVKNVEQLRAFIEGRTQEIPQQKVN